MESNLSKFEKETGNHLVTALSQESVNNAMKTALYSENQEPYHAYVLSTMDETGKTIYFNLNKNTSCDDLPAEFPESVPRTGLFEQIESFHLFDIPSEKEDRTAEDESALEQLYSVYYMDSAYEFINGIPSIFTPQEMKDFEPVDLVESSDPRNCGAVYSQCFNEISVVEFKMDRRNFVVNIQKQSQGSEAWMIGFKVLFNYKSSEYDQLPEVLRENLNKHFEEIPEKDIPNLFEIAQLTMDLKNLSQSSNFEIKGLNTDTQLNMETAFREYVKCELQEMPMDGYVVTPTSKNTYDYIFKPTKYTYSVTGRQFENEKIKTLNYIMSTTNADIQPKEYDWDWITPQETEQKSGVMVVARDIFFEKFNQEFKSRMIPILRKEVIAKVEDNKLFFDKPDMEYEIKNDTSKDNGQFSFGNDGYYEYPKYCQNSISEKGIEIFPPMTIKLEFDYSFSCNAKWGTMSKDGVTYPAVIHTTEIILYSDIFCDAGHSTGNICHRVVECRTGISVDEYGKIYLIKSYENTDKGKTFDVNDWSKVASLNVIDKMVNELVTDVNEWIDSMTKEFTDEFAKNFLGYANWVMLGDKTFTFIDEQFSQYGDFSTGVNYVNPTGN